MDNLYKNFDETVIQKVNALILDGVRNDASDIHLEPVKNKLLIRKRIDGALRDYPPLSKVISPQIISRIKLLAEMDIAERRLPQDGSMYIELEDTIIHIRVSSLPTVFGEKLVLRLLNPDNVIRPLDELGFTPVNLKQYYEFLEHPYGMILVTGPTGCGKTTTLYSSLQHLNVYEKNIITVENPVEYRLDRVNQVQVNSKIGLTFANTLRTVLRQDPDIIMVGEIRDPETAEIVTRAALTGHLVFSTLHTGDAVRSIIRLLDMGIQPFLLTSSLVGIVSQRLVRLVCLNCREPYKPSAKERGIIEAFNCDGNGITFYKGRGCDDCSGTGFKGRTAIHEVMIIDDEVRDMIRSSVNIERVKTTAISKGMTPLIRDGIDKSIQGITTLGEVIRVAYSTF